MLIKVFADYYNKEKLKDISIEKSECKITNAILAYSIDQNLYYCKLTRDGLSIWKNYTDEFVWFITKSYLVSVSIY